MLYNAQLCKDLIEIPDNILCEAKHSVRDIRFDDVGADDVHDDIELEGVGEDGDTEHAES